MWILFVFVLNSQVPIAVVPLNSERACLEAHDQAISLSQGYRQIRAFCVHDSDE